MRVSSVRRPSPPGGGTRIRRSKSCRSEPSSPRSPLASRSASRRSVLRQKSTSVDFPVPRPPMIALSHGLNRTVTGSGRPTYRASAAVTLSIMSSARRALGSSGFSRSARLSDPGPSSSASRNPSMSGRVIFIQVKRRPISSRLCASDAHTCDILRPTSPLLPSSQLSSRSAAGSTSTPARLGLPSTPRRSCPSRARRIPLGPLTCAPRMIASFRNSSRICSTVNRDRAESCPRASTGTPALDRRSAMCSGPHAGSITASR